MAIAARRLGLDPAELAPPQPDRRGRVPLPHAVGRALRLRRLRGLPRATRSSSPATRSGATSRRRRARDGRLVGIGLACVVEPSISNMGYITLAQTAGGARGDAAEVRERGGRDGRHQPARRDHRPDGDDAAGPGPPDGRRAGRRRRARRATRPTSTSLSELDTSHETRGRSPRATTRRASRASGPAPSTAPAQKVAAKLQAIAAAELGCAADEVELRDGKAWHGEESVSLRRLAGHCALAPRRAAGRDRAGPARDRVLRGAESRAAPDDDDRVASSAAHGFLVDVAVVEVDRETGAVRVLDYVSVHDAGPAAEPADRRGPGTRRLRARRRRGAVRAHRLRRGRQPAHGHVHGLPLPDGAGHRRRCGWSTSRRPSPVHAARREGPRRGQRR